MPPEPVEGVVKFRVEHDPSPLEPRTYGDALRVLDGWRTVFVRLGGVGRDPARYDGAGFGNLSLRVPPFAGEGLGRRRFLVTGTQTGGLARVTLDDLCVVEAYDVAENRVTSRGVARPSSESLTHGALYDAAPSARAVFHVHAPELWRIQDALRLPGTRADVAYGTPAMAREVERLVRSGAVAAPGVLAMLGHEDGILSFGASAGEAGAALVAAYARAFAAGGGAR